MQRIQSNRRSPLSSDMLQLAECILEPSKWWTVSGYSPGGQVRLMWLLVTAGMMESRRSDSVAHAQICHLLTSFFQKRHPDASVWKGVSRAVEVETDKADGKYEVISYLFCRNVHLFFDADGQRRERNCSNRRKHTTTIMHFTHCPPRPHMRCQSWSGLEMLIALRDMGSWTSTYRPIYIILYVFHPYA